MGQNISKLINIYKQASPGTQYLQSITSQDLSLQTQTETSMKYKNSHGIKLRSEPPWEVQRLADKTVQKAVNSGPGHMPTHLHT